MSRLRVLAEVVGADCPPRRFTVIGQAARALLALVDAGPRGVTALEASSWAFRFAAYCFDLRHRHGLVIVTERETHPGGWHGRHRLETPVRLIEVGGNERIAA